MIQKNTPVPNILYVVLHGLISLVDTSVRPRDDGFIAYLLDMGNEHSYRYGNWLVEEKIPKRGKGQLPVKAQLLGVESGKAKLDTDLNLVVQIPVLPSENHPFVRAVIRLPRPRDIHHFVSGTVTPGTITGVATAVNRVVADPTQLSGVRVFEYSFEDAAKVTLVTDEGVHLWDCPQDLALLADRKVAVLHVYDEPAEKVPDPAAHSVTEFNKSASFLGVPIQLSKSVKIVEAKSGQDPIPGFLPGETATLDSRLVVVLKMLLDDRTKIPAEDDSGGGGSGGQICSAANAQLPAPAPGQ